MGDKRVFLVLLQQEPPPFRAAFSTAENGRRFWPVFSTEAALLRFFPQGGPVGQIDMAGLKSLADASGIGDVVIDPVPGENHRLVPELPRDRP